MVVHVSHIKRLNKKFWEELNVYFPLICPRTARLAILLCYVCILCRGNVYTEPLSSNEWKLHIYTQGLMGGNYIERH
jgi:hypothetical protein